MTLMVPAGQPNGLLGGTPWGPLCAWTPYAPSGAVIAASRTKRLVSVRMSVLPAMLCRYRRFLYPCGCDGRSKCTSAPLPVRLMNGRGNCTGCARVFQAGSDTMTDEFEEHCWKDVI